MKKIFTFFLFTFFFNTCLSQVASISINGNQSETVCLNENIFIRFRVNNGNNDPYTFTYTVNGALPSQTITTANGSNSVFLPVNNSISGSFIFLLTGVVDNNNNNVNIGSNNEVTITVNSTPAPTISGNLSICDGATSQLTVTGGSSNFNWNESNNNVATVNNNGLVTGQSPGTEIITYENNNGCDNSVLVTVNALPSISIQGGGNGNSICAGSTLNLNGSGTPATTNPWTSSNTAVASVDSSGLVTGVAAGSVTITYTDINGCNATRNITVIAGSAANFTYTNGFLCSGSSVSFNTTSTGNSYTWNFGDGNTSSQQNPTHTFTSFGCGVATYNVSLTINGNNGCPSTITRVITINQQPIVAFEDTLNPFDPFNNCANAVFDSNYSVSVSPTFGNSSCISSYSVSWGDGSPAESFTSFPFTHTYQTLGAFNMAITAIGTNGCSIIKNYTVKNESNPSGGLVSPGSTINLCAPTTSIQFKLSNWGVNSPTTTYSINYGDGSPLVTLLQSDLIQTPFYNSTNPSASLNYPVPHVYNTTTCPGTGISLLLTITNSCGTTTSSIAPIVILQPPTPNFTNTPVACVNSCVSITNTSIPSFSANCTQITRYIWNFGDGSPVFQVDAPGTPNPPCHTYSTAGTYNITLTTIGSCGTYTKTNTICIESPLSPQFTLSGTEFCTPANVTTNNTTNLTNNCSVTYLWNVSYAAGYCGAAPPSWSYTNGTSASSANPSFNFVTPGTYSITLTTTNSCGTVTTLPQTVIVKQPPTVAITSIPDICLGATITPTISVNSCSNLALPTSPPAYSWTAIGGTPSTSNATTPPTFSYSTPGTYTISLSVTNECGTTPAVSNSFIVKANNIVGAASSTPTLCINTTLTPNITHSTTGATGIGTPTGLPAGIIAAWAGNTITISGTPTVSGTFNYSIPLTGGCGTVNATGTITVTSSNTATPGVITNLCINTALSPNIIHTTTGATGIGNATGLPTGVTATWSSNTITISGTPTASGTFNYSIPLIGGCGIINATGNIIVTPLNTVNPGITTTLCLNSPLTPNITHTTTSATGIGTATGLPTGVNATWAGNTITISGTPTVSGTFNYSIPLSGGCGTVNATGTIIVTTLNTVTPGITTTLCINTTLTPNITHTTTGATGIGTATGLPTGVNATWVGNTITISGTPTVSGTFNYNIPLSGGCGNVNATGTIIVTTVNTATPGITTTSCINTTLSPNITHTTIGATGIGTAIGLPTGVTATWSSNTITISGTPTVSGTFNYSIPLTGGCGTVNATGTITVRPDNTAGVASSLPTLCINTALSPNITHTTTGATGIGTATGLPTGVNATWAGNTITISGTPTVSGTFNYSIPLTGGCGTVIATGTITVTPLNTATPGITTTLCINTALTPDITHTTTGATGIGNATGLPTGVSATWAGNTITISGTPTVSGTFNYSIPLIGGCGAVNATGTITISINSPGVASYSPNLCINTALTPNITHTTTLATGIGTATGLPTGVTATWAGNTITISGTPTVSGTFNYSIPLTGGCGTVNATGTITVRPDNTAGVASSSPTLCINTALSPNITHTTTGATGIGTATGLPTGVNATWAGNTITISGTPTVSGTFNYSIPLTGGCGTVIATGTITVTPLNTATPGITTTLCINTALTPDITHTTTGATGIGNATGLPTGVSATWAGNTITISGTPTVSGTFNYSIPLIGGCGAVNATGTITISINSPGVASYSPNLCINTALTPNITHTTTLATGIGTATGLPTGVTATWAGNTITISGTPTVSGTFNYSIPLTGGCGTVNASGTLTVNAEPLVANQTQTICSDAPAAISLNTSSSVAATTYNITNINTNGLSPFAGNPIPGTGLAANIITDDAWTNTTPSPVNVVYTVVPVSAAGCQGNPFTVTLTIDPEPVVANQISSICSDVANGVILGNDIDTPQATTYNITNINPNGLPFYAGNPTTGIGLAANVIADDAWTNTTPSAVNVIYTVVPVSAGGCQGNPFTVTLTVESTLGVGPQTVPACSNEAIGFVLGTAPNTTYDITAINQNGLTASAGNPVIGTDFTANEIADDAWTNETALPVNVIYTVLPVSSNGCIGQPFTVTATINPEPVVSNQTDTICSDNASGVSLNLSSSVIASTYNITNINQNGLTPSAGNPVIGNNLAVNVIADDAWTNTTPSPVNVVYTVVPVSAAGCQGNPFTVTLTIDPEPVVANQISSICSDVANGVILGNDIDTPQATTYNITNINPNGLPFYAGNPTTGIGLAANVIADDAWTNTTPSAVNVIYTVVPVSAGGCQGNPFTVTLTVESTLGVGPQTVPACSNEAIGFVLGTAPNTTYDITAINQNGLTASAGNPVIGTDFTANEIADDAWTNETALPVNVIYTVLPVSSNGCIGQPFTVTATINPEPVVSNQTDTICSDNASGVSLNLSSSVIASTYNITNINQNGLTPSAGNPVIGNNLAVNVIADDAWTNTTPSPINVVYTVVPVSAAGCQGNPFTVTLTIDPEPVVANQISSICSDVANGVILGNDIDTPQATTYNITNINPNGLPFYAGNPTTGIGLAANVIADDAWTNTTPSAVNVIYTVVPVSDGGCQGNPFTVTLTVESALGVGPQTIAACSDEAIGFVLGTAPNTTYDITAINQNGLTASAGNPVIGTDFTANVIADDAWTNETALPVNVIYTVLPVSSNGCIGQPFTVTATINPEPVVSNQTDTICSDNASGVSLNLSSSVIASTYNITNINQNGLTPSAGNPVIGNNIAVNVIADDAWTNTTPSPVNVVYTVVPVSAAGCQGNPFTVTLTIDPEPVVANQTSTICSDVANGVILGNDIDTPQATTYNITNINPNGLPFYAGNPTTGIGLAANVIADDAWTNTTPSAVNVIYTVVPVSAGGCQGNPFTVTITVESALGVGPQTIAACSDEAIGFVLGTAPNTTYDITAINQNGLTASAGNPVIGTDFTANEIADDAWTNETALPVNVIYTVLPVSSNGCIGQPFTVTATINPELVVSNQTDTICSDNASGVSLNLSSSVIASTYNITNINQNGLTPSAGNPVIGNNLAVNVIADDAWTNTTPSPINVVYTVVPVSAAGCQGNPFTVTLTIDPEPVVANQTSTICSDVANGVILGNDIDTPSVATYTITNINSNGLVASAGSPVIGSGFSPNEISDDAWTNTTPTAVDVIYTVVPVSSDNCQGNPFTVTVTIESELDINSQSIVLCSTSASGVILGLEPTATYTITSIVSNGLLPFSGNPILGPGFLADALADDAWINIGTAAVEVVYTITPQSSSGCLGNPFSITMTINPEPVVISQDQIVCSDEPSNLILGNDLDGPNASTYNITAINSNGLTPFSGNPQVGSGLLANEIANDAWTNTTSDPVLVVYQVVPVSAIGCQGVPFNVNLSINPQINVNIVTTPITCYGANNASITLNVTGGTAPYVATWNNLATGFYQNNLSAGTYIITITDNRGCSKIETVVIPEAPVFMVNPIVSNVTCNGANNGSINLNLTGGIAPVTLTWSDGSTSGLIRNNLPPGTYTATISDGTPCYIVRTFTIVQPLPLVVSGNITNPLDCDNASSGAINLIVSGGTPPFNYSWTNGNTTEDLTNVVAGNYGVTVTDANNCVASSQFSLTRPDPIQIAVSTQIDFDCALHEVTQNFIAQASGGVPPYQYQWSSGNVSGVNGEIMNSDIDGTVILTVFDSLGCSATYTVEIDNPEIGYSSFDSTSLGYTTYGIYSIGDPIQFNSNVTGDYVSISWDFGDGTFSTELNPIHTYLIPRDYVITQTVTYPFGCVYVQTITLVVEKGYLLVVPTAFTPNNDSLNDTYRPVSKRLKNIRLDIYDTFGSLIYTETGDVLIGWDGKINGFNAENGNYYSKVSAETFYGTIINENQTFVLIK